MTLTTSRPSSAARIRVARRAAGHPGRGHRTMARVLTVVGVLAIWQLCSATGALDPRTVPSPTQILVELGGLVGESGFWYVLGLTMLSWAIGLGISILVAVPAGLLLGSSQVAYRSCRFTIDFLRTIPPVALVPLALLLFGATTQMKLVLVVLGAVWPLLLQSMYGVHQIDPVARETFRSYRVDRWRQAIFLILPGAAPFVATGVRIAATMALLLTIGAELIGNAQGVGNSIGLAEIASNVPRLFAFIVVSAVLGVVINAVLAVAERRLLSWHAAHRTLRGS